MCRCVFPGVGLFSWQLESKAPLKAPPESASCVCSADTCKPAAEGWSLGGAAPRNTETPPETHKQQHKCFLCVSEGERDLVEAQVVLDGVGGVEDGPAGADDQDEAVQSLEVKRNRRSATRTADFRTHCVDVAQGN